MNIFLFIIEMLKTFKYRIYPNIKQIQHFNQSFGNVRYLYNKALELRTSHYQETGKNLTYFDLQNSFLLKEKSENIWLKNTYSQNLQVCLRNLDNAFMRFFHKKSGYPKFKSKKDNHNSLQYTQGVKVDFKNNQVWIPKCGKIKIKLSRTFEGKIKTCTVSKTPTNKYFISILVDNGASLPEKSLINEQTSLGIDLGIKHFAITSNGEKYNNPKHLRSSINKLKIKQKRLSKKVKGSNNYKKERLKLAILHEKIANQRKDFLHKLSTNLLNSDNQTIILEDLAISNMLKNHNLALSISDCGWGMFKNMLGYKAEWKGKNIIYIGRFEPSSKLCSNCFVINKELKLEDREWTCAACQEVHDRDINAAKNIKRLGLKMQEHFQTNAGLERPKEPTEIPQKKISKAKLKKSKRVKEVGNV